jgi:hypothetical protein
VLFLHYRGQHEQSSSKSKNRDYRWQLVTSNRNERWDSQQNENQLDMSKLVSFIFLDASQAVGATYTMGWPAPVWISLWCAIRTLPDYRISLHSSISTFNHVSKWCTNRNSTAILSQQRNTKGENSIFLETMASSSPSISSICIFHMLSINLFVFYQ